MYKTPLISECLLRYRRSQEEKQNKVVTEDDLREERRQRELRWHGNLEGFEVVRPDKEAAWDERFNGWLRLYVAPQETTAKETVVE